MTLYFCCCCLRCCCLNSCCLRCCSRSRCGGGRRCCSTLLPDHLACLGDERRAVSTGNCCFLRPAPSSVRATFHVEPVDEVHGTSYLSLIPSLLWTAVSPPPPPPTPSKTLRSTNTFTVASAVRTFVGSTGVVAHRSFVVAGQILVQVTERLLFIAALLLCTNLFS